MKSSQDFVSEKEMLMMETTLSAELKKHLLAMQQDEITGSILYGKIADRQKDAQNKQTFQEISRAERGHYETWKAYTGQDEFDGTITFMGQPLYYSHTTPEKLAAQIEAAGLVMDDARYRTIADETFLWVTVRKPL